MKKIAIIGSGLSGIVALTHLVTLYKKNKKQIEISIYEKDLNYLASGFPYHIGSPHEWILNGPPANRFKLHPKGRTLEQYINENFAFLKEHFPSLEKDEKFPPRAVVGHYLKSELALCLKENENNSNINIKIINDEAINIERHSDNNLEVSSKNNNKLVFDNVFLCLGHLSSDHYKEFKDLPNFISSPWDTTKLQTIPTDENINTYIIGGHLTFIDTSKWLVLSHQYKGKIVSVTRNHSALTTRQDQRRKSSNDNKVKNPRIEEALTDLSTAFENSTQKSMDISKFKAIFWHSVEKLDLNEKTLASYNSFNLLKQQLPESETVIQSSLYDYQDFITQFYVSGIYSSMWEALSETAKLEFHQQFYSHIVAWVAGIPPTNARFLIELHEQQRIIEMEGLSKIEYDQEKKLFILHFKNGEQQTAEYLINATGMGSNVLQLPPEHLITRLISNGLIEASQFGFTISNNCPNLFAIGPKPAGNKPGLYASFLACAEADEFIKKIEEQPLEEEVNDNSPSTFSCFT